jgi:hypothetical protein
MARDDRTRWADRDGHRRHGRDQSLDLLAARRGGCAGAVCDLDAAAAKRTASQLPGKNAALPLDVTDDSAVVGAVQAVGKEWGRSTSSSTTKASM